ncbi:hypothetical protein OO006_11335 [Prosthecochloris sp. SCSIO W1101]|uniref:hypothetical protein n=2 Tax=Prosthecochloris sp. SCSIO W1101 TaxID=2992242 RepID=UPI00223E53E6|nr:hypothetical protein [Prosthecochloris sp. SCSIO W1101]UZJ40934.1 hypothetical protein OO006_11335 [Prosthecochloris sp. SCSIO W1101]
MDPRVALRLPEDDGGGTSCHTRCGIHSDFHSKMDPRVMPEDDRERSVIPDMMRHPWRETSEPMDPRVALRLPEDDWKRETSCRT